MTAKDERVGLAWEPECFSNEMRPQWEIDEPGVGAILTLVRQELHIGSWKKFSTEILAKGSASKVYAIHRDVKVDYIMRISLPVEPHRKTLSEQATIEYVRQHTKISVPEVITLSMQSSNTLGFEWTIMQRIPGDKLCEPVASYELAEGGAGTQSCRVSGAALQQALPSDWQSLLQGRT